MSLPILAPIPPASVRLSLGDAEWQACLDAWLTLAEIHLRTSTSTASPVATFFRSYYHELTHLAPNDDTLRTPKATSLHKLAFALVKKAFLEANDLGELLDWDFLADLCRAHVKSTRSPELLGNLWLRKSDDLQNVLQKRKDALITKIGRAHV